MIALETETFMDKIASRSRTLLERIAQLKATGLVDTLPDLAVLAEWQEAAAAGDADKFARRLAALGLSPSEAVALFREEADSATNTGEWLAVLEAVWFEARQLTETDSVLVPDAPEPFEEVLLPFVRVARRYLEELHPAGLNLLSETARQELEQGLLHRLSSLSQKALGLEFGVYRASRSFGLFLATMQPDATESTTPPSREIYLAFVQQMLQAGGLARFLEKYSVLARLLSEAVLSWVANSARFLERVATDLPYIRDHFSDAAHQIAGLVTNLSDPHRGGQSVLIVRFDSGLKLVYKPRSLAVEQAFQELLEWCNRQALTLDFKTLRVLTRESYGWVEFAHAEACPTEQGQKRYHQRMGMLLAVLHLLRGADYHYQNLLGCGEYPVAIDQEALLYPEVRNITAESQINLAYREFSNTVLRIGLLPAWNVESDGEISDVSGLGGVAPKSHAVWVAVNTDRMNLRNLPIAAEKQPDEPDADYVEELVAGFTEVYQLFLAKRPELLQTCSPLAAFKAVQTRFILRNTRIYASLLSSSLEPRFLQNGLTRSIQLDRLCRALLGETISAGSMDILQAELATLEKLDIPLLTATSNSTALFLDEAGEFVPDFFIRPGYEQVLEQFGKWDTQDLARQSGYIRASFYAKKQGSVTGSGPITPVQTTPLNFTTAEMINEAREIGLALEAQALRDGGAATWIYLGFDKRLNRYRLNPLDFSLYSGIGGVAVFLAALGKTTGEQRFASLARAAWESRLPLFKQPHQANRIARQMGIGGALGLGSLVYSLTLCAQLLDDSELLESALALLDLDPAIIETDKCFDLIFGSAGALLSFLKVYSASGDERALKLALRCGYHLLASRTASENGLRAWATLEGKLATGYSHGAAGIALALLRLYGVTGKTEFKVAAEVALAFEDSQFVAVAGNWLYYRSQPQQPQFWTTWCHGAPGIGLARLVGLPYLDNPAVREDISRALVTTQAYGLREIDNLCCGNFGRIELLTEAATRTGEQHWSKLAQRWTNQLIARAHTDRGYHILPGTSGDLYSPGFFQGTSGVGYSLLRLALPGSLPSVLAWE